MNIHGKFMKHSWSCEYLNLLAVKPYQKGILPRLQLLQRLQNLQGYDSIKNIQNYYDSIKNIQNFKRREFQKVVLFIYLYLLLCFLHISLSFGPLQSVNTKWCLSFKYLVVMYSTKHHYRCKIFYFPDFLKFQEMIWGS